MFPKLNSPSSSLFLKKALPSWVISDCSFPRVMGWSSLFHYLRSLPSLRPHSTAITAFPEVQASCTRALSRDYRINFLVAQLHDPHPLVQIFSVPQRLTGQRPNSPCYLKLSMAHLARLVSFTPHYQTPYSLGTQFCAFPNSMALLTDDVSFSRNASHTHTTPPPPTKV